VSKDLEFARVGTPVLATREQLRDIFALLVSKAVVGRAAVWGP
jgi:hypothetical protein